MVPWHRRISNVNNYMLRKKSQTFQLSQLLSVDAGTVIVHYLLAGVEDKCHQRRAVP